MSRQKFSDDELADNIWQPDLEKEMESIETPTVIAYTIPDKSDGEVNGNHIILDETSDFAYAKRNGREFFVKSNGGQLSDPFGLYDRDIYRRVGDHATWRWRRTSPKVFEFYLAYLRTKNKVYFRNAEREML